MAHPQALPSIELVVNGEPVRLRVSGTVPLLTVLRNDLGLVGARAGCGVGECGACTVLVDGVPTRSCDLPVEAAADAHVVTPEGLGTPGSLHPVQRAFVDAGAAQCGYCINGIITTTAGILDRGGTEHELLAALDEHLCRCGTHARILDTVRTLVGAVPSGMDRARRIPGTSLPPPDDDGGLPPSLAAAPRIEDWVELLPDGRVAVEAAKSEIGQGILAAFARIVATRLGIGVSLVEMRRPETGRSPDEGFTSGSRSIMVTGHALGMAAAALRRRLLERAAGRLGSAADRLSIDPAGRVVVDDGRAITFAGIREDGPVTGMIESADRADWAAEGLAVPTPRIDLPAKLSGAPAYVHDLRFPGMLHVRALLPPTYDATLVDVDLAVGRLAPGVLRVVRDGSLLLAIAEREEQAVTAVTRLGRTAVWDLAPIRQDADPESWLRGRPGEAFVAAPGPAPAMEGGTRVSATYTRPYHAHGPMAPSCAVARVDGERLTVWSHTQGVHPLRAELATLLGLDPGRIDVVHGDGPGCYGMSGADDAAAFAAIAALDLPGRHVRFQHSHGDELGWDPLGSAMAADLTAALDPGGNIASWRMRSLTDVHSARPRGQGDRLVPSWLRAERRPRPWTGPGETGARNAVPLYDLPAPDVVVDHVRGDLRTGPLRSLASFHHVFAIESFMDELAEAAGADPVEFRRRHLADPRAVEVLEVAAGMAGWEPRVGPSGRGIGIGLCRYKGSAAYAAVAVRAAVDPADAVVRVHEVWVACDAGTVIDDDGLRNQLEGGVVQALSRVLHEEVTYDEGGVRSRDWTSYPVIRFSEVPEIHTALVGRAGWPPLGAGEVSTPPTAGALANAVDDAIGLRLRAMPFTPDRIRRRLYEMTPGEGERLLV